MINEYPRGCLRSPTPTHPPSPSLFFLPSFISSIFHLFADRKEVYQVRWERELREIRECKGIGKKEESCKSGKSEDLSDNVIGSSRKKKCDKFESIDSTTTNDNDLYPRSISYNQIGNSFDVPFGTVPIGTSLLNFGMRSNNVIPNRSFSMTKMTMDIQREELPILVENESIDKESPDEESTSE